MRFAQGQETSLGNEPECLESWWGLTFPPLPPTPPPPLPPISRGTTSLLPLGHSIWFKDANTLNFKRWARGWGKIDLKKKKQKPTNQKNLSWKGCSWNMVPWKSYIFTMGKEGQLAPMASITANVSQNLHCSFTEVRRKTKAFENPIQIGK